VIVAAIVTHMIAKLRAAARVALVAATTAGVCGLAAAPAHADPPAVATLVMSGEMHYDAAAGQANWLRVTNPAPGIVQFTDVVPITYSTPDGSTCWYPYATTTTVWCEHLATFLDIKTYDGDDRIENRTVSNVHANGGDDDDVIIMGGHVTSSAAGDANGGAGDDVIYSGPGDDWIEGGTGVDTVSFQGRTAVITASLVTNHGGSPSTSEVDNYLNVENLTGGGSADTLTGNDLANVLDGGWYTTPCSPTPLAVAAKALAPPPCTTYSGEDTINGNGGNDTLRGRQGADNLNGGSGNDILYGDSGFDALNGGLGSDSCHPGADGATTVSCVVS
jgi:Ca2+-binding RTX toxin-like protein